MGKKLKMLGTNVLLKVEEPKKESKGGIVLPDSAQERTNVAKVLNVGECVEGIKKKDKVLFDHKGMMTKVEMNDQTFFICDAEDILAIVD